MATTRRYTARDLVVLPRLSASSALALATKVLSTAAAQRRIPRALEAPIDALARARDDLHTALRAPEPSGRDADAPRNADLVIDTAWGALHDWLTGWTRNAKCPHKGVAALHARLFPSGLDFLTLRYADEWSASDTRLATLDEPSARSLVRALGGESFVANLREAHAAYGRLIGVTAPAVTEAERGDVREALEHTLEALRTFVLATAHIATTGPRSHSDLADTLLAPLTEWETPSTQPLETETKPAPEPTPSPAPADPKKR